MTNPAQPRFLSHSEYRTYKSCKRAWYLAYYRNLHRHPDEEIVTGLMQLGTAVHLALEGHYGHGLDAHDVLINHYQDLATRYPHAVDSIHKERDLAQVMVAGYLDWAAEEGIDAEYEVVGAEADLQVPIALGHRGDDGPQVILRGRLDQAVRARDEAGTLFLRDFKTTGSMIRGIELRRDEQMKFYALLQWLTAGQTSERVGGALYTLILRSKRTVAATPPFYSVIPIPYNRDEMESMLLRVRRVATEIHDTIAELEDGVSHLEAAYPNPGGSCGYCAFAQVCHLADDGSRFDDALQDLYVTGDPMGHYGTARIDEIKQLMGL